MITNEMKAKVTAKLQQCIDIANKRYNINVKFPTVSYNLRGTTAGRAHYRSWIIELNAVLLSENFDAMLEDTVPHELAHLVTEMVYPEAHESDGYVRTRRGYRRAKRSVHGIEWQSVMRVLGANPTRTHDYDTTNSKVRNKASYEYKCNCCGEIVHMGPKRHANEQRNPGYYTHSSCGRVRGKLTLVSSVAPAATVHTKPMSTSDKKPALPATGSKLDKCYSIYKMHPTLPRKDLIQMFVFAGCTPAGASTYHATCKKMYESGK